MCKVTIIVPILNELDLIPSFLEYTKVMLSDYKIVFVDGGSTDGSIELLEENLDSNEYIFLKKDLKDKSILATILIAKGHVNTEFILIHPIDCQMKKKLKLNFNLSHDYYLFKKYYDNRSLLFRIYELVQNHMLLENSKGFVWTNMPLIKTSIILNLQSVELGFLEDLQLSNYLKTHFTGTTLDNHSIISTRKYNLDGNISRIIKNILILCLFKTRLFKPKSLKSLYK